MDRSALQFLFFISGFHIFTTLLMALHEVELCLFFELLSSLKVFCLTVSLIFPALLKNVACFCLVSGDGHLGGSPARKVCICRDNLTYSSL